MRLKSVNMKFVVNNVTPKELEEARNKIINKED